MNVDLGDNFFSPESVTVTVGTTLIWHHRGEGEVPHNVVSTDGLFNSGDLQPGSTFTYSFSKTGRYQYVCTYHVREMAAEVFVQ